VKTLRILRCAFLSGARDYAAIYTWKSWLAGWYVRILAQVIFFAMIGSLLRADEQTWFLLVGNATMLAAADGVWALNQAIWERVSGSLPLLVASPSSPVLVFVSRGAYQIANGFISAVSALFVAGPLFGLPLPWPEVLLVIPLLMLISAAAYCFGTFLGGVVLRVRWISNLVANVGIVALMTLCAVNVPLDAYPEPASWVAQFLPLTHGLLGIRDVLSGDLSGAATQAALEFAVGAAWLLLCVATFGRFVDHGRHDGSIEFAT
jgi:ABC-2 type transport system permease protein